MHPKTFKEYIKSYLGGYRLGNYDNITPIERLMMYHQRSRW